MPLVELHGEVKRAIFLARYSRELEPDALTGQALDTLTFLANTATDIWDDTVDTIGKEPSWVWDSVSERMYLEIDADAERLSYLFPYDSTFPMGGLLEFIAHAYGTSDLLRLGQRDESTPYLFLEHDGSAFKITHHNGVSSVSSSVTHAVAAGSLYTVRWAYNASGAVQIWYSKDGDDEVAGSASGALSPAAAWSEAKMHVVATTTGSGGDRALLGLLAISSDPAATLEELQNLF